MKADKRAKLKALWEQRLKAWQASGLSQADWCREQNFNPHQFTYWKQKLQPAKVGDKLIPLAISPVRDPDDYRPVIIHLDNVRLEAPLHQVPELLRALKVVS